MNDDEDKSPVKVEIALRAELKAEIKAELSQELTDGWGFALLDIIRPWTEKRGLKADQIRLQRVDVLTEVLSRGEGLLESKEIKITPPPNKFMVPLMENASREEPESELIDRWAGLLASAGSKYEEQLVEFTEILASLGPNSVKLLEGFYESKKLSDQGPMIRTLSESNFEIVDSLIPHEDFFTYNVENATKAAKNVLEASLQGPFIVKLVDIIAKDRFEVERSGPGSLAKSTITLVHDNYMDERVSWDSLDRNGLVRRYDRVFRSPITGMGVSRFLGSVTMYELTPTGIDFVRRCKGITD